MLSYVFTEHATNEEMKRVIPNIKLVNLNKFDIFHQLRIEEVLLRSNTSNWCILNHGTPKSVVVTGLGGVIPDLINTNALVRYETK